MRLPVCREPYTPEVYRQKCSTWLNTVTKAILNATRVFMPT